MGLKLMALDVSYNKIEEIPEQIGDLMLLKELKINDNALTVSPQAQATLKQPAPLLC